MTTAQKEKLPVREQEAELIKMRRLELQDQIEYLLAKIQAQEEILQNIMFLADLAEKKIQEFSMETTIELKRKYLSERTLE